MSSQAQSILFAGCFDQQDLTAPATGVTAKSNATVKDLDCRAVEEFLNSLAEAVLPTLAIDDGSQPFSGDATNDWFYPGRSLRNGTLPEVDLVIGE